MFMNLNIQMMAFLHMAVISFEIFPCQFFLLQTKSINMKKFLQSLIFAHVETLCNFTFQL